MYAAPMTLPRRFAELVTALAAELGAIARESREPTVNGIVLKQLNAVPPRLTQGLTVLADGVNWNPGAGAGVYTYYGGAWNKLG